MQSPVNEPEAPPRALSFGAVAEEYDRCRPAPPRAALRWLLPSSCLFLAAMTH